MDVTPLPVREMTVRGELHLFCPRGCKSARLGKRIVSTAQLQIETVDGTVVLRPDNEGPPRTLTSLEPRYTNDSHSRYPSGTWWRMEDSASPTSRGRQNRKIYKQGYVYNHYGFQYRRRDYVPSESALQFLKRYTTERYDHDREYLPAGEHVVICYRCGLPSLVSA